CTPTSSHTSPILKNSLSGIVVAVCVVLCVVPLLILLTTFRGIALLRGRESRVLFQPQQSAHQSSGIIGIGIIIREVSPGRIQSHFIVAFKIESPDGPRRAEDQCPPFGQLNRFTGHRVAATPLAPFDDFQRAEPDDVNLIALEQLSPDDVNDQVYDAPRFLFGDAAMPVVDGTSQFCLGHRQSTRCRNQPADYEGKLQRRQYVTAFRSRVSISDSVAPRAPFGAITRSLVSPDGRVSNPRQKFVGFVLDLFHFRLTVILPSLSMRAA